MTTESSKKTIYLKDYSAPYWLIRSVDIRISIANGGTIVSSTLEVIRSSKGRPSEPLRLNGVGLELVALEIDGSPVSVYSHEGEELVIPDDGKDAFTLKSRVRIYPEKNTALEGLYSSNGMMCTQCEAEGFRKITYFPDRPDVMSSFTTTIEADKEKYPVLLSNGNLVASGDLEGGRHYATWHDPFPKPSYLFAAVAGDLACLSDSYVTTSGRKIDLRIYVEAHDMDKIDHAMASLKRSMRWDEEVYGREYDLDVFMIVAVSHFNMGAMENKGLNIFNTSCVLAHPAVATDAAFQRVESVVAHEYFHNWTGNRVTCRDWFQLSLKEGFTVFRDQQFSADMLSASVQRIEDVNFLRSWQFAEDAGPLAHPVRPESFVEINNFYTSTVYEKGAEIVRMIYTVLGKDGFRAGSDLYFARHDGQAVTVEDFVRAMSDASGVDLSSFMKWYGQPGTPVLSAKGAYDSATRQYRLLLSQENPQVQGFLSPGPLPIPVKVGLIGSSGQDMAVVIGGVRSINHVLMLEDTSTEFVFSEVDEPPVLSLLRDFSAPVKVRQPLSQSERLFLVRHDSNGFNRWLAVNELLIEEVMHVASNGGRLRDFSNDLVRVLIETVPVVAVGDPALAAKLLQFPAVQQLLDVADGVDPGLLHEARQHLRLAVAKGLEHWLLTLVDAAHDEKPYAYDAASIGSRSLANTALGLLVDLSSVHGEIAARRFGSAGNMTDQYAALMALVHGGRDQGGGCLEAFARQWRDEALVMDQWFSVQASAPSVETVERVAELLKHAGFERTNPNRVRALLGQFANANPVAFHRADGAGYALLCREIVLLDAINPQVAARLLGACAIWRRLDAGRQAALGAELGKMAELDLSPDVKETLARLLGEVC